jgi:hypothetical protein
LIGYNQSAKSNVRLRLIYCLESSTLKMREKKAHEEIRETFDGINIPQARS